MDSATKFVQGVDSNRNSGVDRRRGRASSSRPPLCSAHAQAACRAKKRPRLNLPAQRRPAHPSPGRNKSRESAAAARHMAL